MNRSLLATALLLSAALATAGCSGGQAPSHSAAATSTPSGAQSYASMLDLYSAVLGTGTTCSGVTIEPAPTAKSEAGCDLGNGGQLVLQTWRAGASRDAGVSTAVTALAGKHIPYCTLEGVGATGLWSLEASNDSGVCAEIAQRLGGHVTSSAGSH